MEALKQESSLWNVPPSVCPGQVYEFDKSGLKVGKLPAWTQCVAVPVIAQQNNAWYEFWDYTLSITEGQEQWNSSE